MENKIVLTDQQQNAIKMTFENKVSILTGGPGTGKSTVLKNILDFADKEKINYRLACPTGKGAKRIIETTGRFASTIHSLLVCGMDEDGKWVFGMNEDNYLFAGLIVIDEISMIDNSLMSDLLRAIHPDKTRLLLVGDSDQLPSVGPGAILRDMLESGMIPHTELDIIHRNSGKIVEACSLIKDGDVYEKETKIDLDTENPVNLVHVDVKTPERAVEVIRDVISQRMPLRNFDPVWDVQVISPVNKKGKLSCENLNKVLRDALNPQKNEIEGTGIFDPEGTKTTGGKYRVGDKVINTKNMKTVDKLGKPHMIVNGDIGVILENDDKKFLIIKFFDPERIVKISRGNNKLLHGYAITCHRFQGSESPVVVIPIEATAAYIFNRNWLYTAVSRGKTLVITVGDFKAIRQMIHNTRGENRVTLLKESIIEKFEFEKEIDNL